jgi:mannose-6-phosphate isomerase-like protein (cupin superfamily)
MPFITADEAVVHEMHGARFVSYAASALGSRELCRLAREDPTPERRTGHTISREEVFPVLSGSLELTIDGWPQMLDVGDAAAAPAGSSLSVADPTEEPAGMRVTTSVGLTATLADGSQISPLWAN